MTRVIISGGRSWNCPRLAERIIARLVARYGVSDLTIVHGHCPTGVDHCFDVAATDACVAVEQHPADWDQHGKSAGPRRNATMVNAGADMLIAVHKSIGYSRGTRGCAKLAIAAGIPIYLIDSETGEPRRIRELP